MDISELGRKLAHDYGSDVLEPESWPILEGAMVRAGFPVTLGTAENLELEIRRALGLPYAEPES